MTLEEAQERILELEEANRTLEEEKNLLAQNNDTLKEDIERVRTLNQRYFEKLSMQSSGKPDPEEEEEPQTCEEFAKTITI